MTAPRYKTTKWHHYDNFECLLCPFATLDRGQMVQHVRERHPTPAEVERGAAHPLSAVPFASDEAAELALAEELEPADFAAHSPTGKTGYVLGDVRRIAASRSSSTSPLDPRPAEEAATTEQPQED